MSLFYAMRLAKSFKLDTLSPFYYKLLIVVTYIFTNKCFGLRNQCNKFMSISYQLPQLDGA